jgi:cytochrome b subunit of formate dehydrogenase
VSKEQQYPRFRLGAQIEHIILMLSFTVLSVTGLPQKYAETAIGENMINLMGGIEIVRLIHRGAAFALIAGAAYHLLAGAYRLFVKHERMRILPDKKDVFDVRDTVTYNLGFRAEHPKMRKFNYGEKVEYWAVVWGTAVMVITGFMLLNPIATTSLLPGEIIPAALAAHGWEAVLAAVSIVIWHFYNVHVKVFNLSMWTGKMSRKQMEEEHALELERLEAGGSPWQEVQRPVLQRRRRIFIIVSLVIGVFVLAGLVWMFTFEDTSIGTAVPRVTEQIFVPLATSVP